MSQEMVESMYDVQYGTIDATPEEAGYYAPKLDELDAHFMELVQTGELQCASYLLSRNGKVFASRSMGKLDFRDEHKLFLPDSIRRIASVTKLFTSLAVMKLMEEGKLLLDQPIASWIPEFDTPMHKGITVFHLLTHTSGMAADSGYFTEPYPRGWWEGAKGDNWIKSMLAGTLLNEPGKAWNYSSSGFAVLGELISILSGLEYEKYIERNLIEPVGMESTFFKVPENLHEQVCVTSEWDLPRTDKADESNKKRPPRAGGGLHSTLRDLWQLGQMMLNHGECDGRRILGRKTIELMTRNHLHNVPGFHWGARKPAIKYGLGVQLREIGLASPETYSHEGAGRCAIYIDPVEQFIAVYMVPTNTRFIERSVVHPRSIMWSGIL
ncbi:serine hydrolase domain-containing protein [Paenibacillus sp. RC67]|uniref:serine hydrolase domain-containing protein n=1 Tax=Paenibacillus sp. RC67 TaxID=3039392 RepID=UPI0024AD422F|nr:serine hydrolase domain-containing protein [Paenibacillus sp. RC67]